jgi:hypothetical protein
MKTAPPLKRPNQVDNREALSRDLLHGSAGCGGGGEWEWSSARAHLGMAADTLLAPGRLFPAQWAGQWEPFLAQELTAHEVDWIRQNIATGRPTASREYVKSLELETGRV